jgi:hypothetical protein
LCATAYGVQHLESHQHKDHNFTLTFYVVLRHTPHGTVSAEHYMQ